MDRHHTEEASEGKATRPEPTAAFEPDERPTAVDHPDLQARIEAAILATEDEAQPREDLLIGKVIAHRFEVVSRIGAGGMGIVYKARQLGMDRWVAVKLLLRELAHDEKIVRRFKVEALAASRLTHPNTIRIYDFGQTDDGDLYIAMEYLEGQSLERVISKEGPLPVRRVLHIMKQIAASLGEAHSKGIVHRDLKPDNIFLISVDNDPDFVKVLDFGIAKLREADKRQGTLTQAGVIFGTPRYMAPEQCRSMSVDHRADIYALGVIAYEALTQVPPFDGETPLSILIKHVQEPPRPMSVIRPDLEIPEEVGQLVMKCLEKAPDQRFQDTAQLQAEIARLEASLSDRFERVIVLERPRPVVPEMRAETAVSPQRFPNKAKKWGLLLPVLALAMGVGLWKMDFFSKKVDLASDMPVQATYVPEQQQTKPVATESRNITLRFRSEPPGARVLLDGETDIGKTPFTRDFAASNEKRSFKFVLDGFKPAVVWASMDVEAEVVAALERESRIVESKPAKILPKTKESSGEPKKEEAPSRIGDLKKTPF